MVPNRKQADANEPKRKVKVSKLRRKFVFFLFKTNLIKQSLVPNDCKKTSTKPVVDQDFILTLINNLTREKRKQIKKKYFTNKFRQPKMATLVQLIY